MCRWFIFTALLWGVCACIVFVTLQTFVRSAASDALIHETVMRVRTLARACEREAVNAGYTSLRQMDQPLMYTFTDALEHMRMYGAVYYSLRDAMGLILIDSVAAQQGTHTGYTEHDAPDDVRVTQKHITIENQAVRILDVDVPLFMHDAYAGSIRIGFVMRALTGREALAHMSHHMRLTSAYLLIIIILCALVHTAILARCANTRITDAYTKTEEKNAQMMQKFGVGITHEVKNALNGIRMNADLLLTRVASLPDAASLEKKVRRIADEATRTGHMLTDILTYTAPLNFAPEPANLRAILHDITQFFVPICRQYAITITEECPPTLSHVTVDEKLLRHALSNLLWNAIHAMDETGGTLSLTATHDDTTIHISVCDTGGGMSPETEQKAFDLFFSTTHKGAGLGLSIVQRSVETHNGTLTYDNRPGDGCTFTLHIPLSHHTPHTTTDESYTSHS